jgi:hypothetical protein
MFPIRSSVAPIGNVALLQPTTVKRILTTAEVLTLNTVPIIVVPAQAGVIQLPIFSLLVYKFGGVAFTGGGSVSLGWTGGWTLCNWNWGAGFGGGASILNSQMGSSGDTAYTTGVGSPLILAMATGNPAAGNGTLELTVFYSPVFI